MILKMTLPEYKALRRGAMLRRIDDMELMYDHAFKTALAGSFDKHGKPIFRNLKDMFDRKKVERELLEGFGEKQVDPQLVDNFVASKEAAENIINEIKFGRKEENDVKHV